MNRIATTAMIVLLAMSASAKVIEQWDFTGNSLVGTKGHNMTFVNSGGNVDQTGGAFDNTFTVNRSGGFSGNVITNLNINSTNSLKVVMSFTIAAWDMTKSGSNGYWGLRLRDVTNGPVAEFRFGADSTGGTKIVLDGEYGQITDSGLVNRTAAIGGLVTSNQASATPLTVSLTLDMVNSTYTLESTAWYNQYVSQGTGTIAGLSNAVIDNLSWAWTQINDTPVTAAPGGDFIELDQIALTTVEPPTYGDSIVEQWDFTGNSLTGTNGNSTTSFFTAGNVDETGGAKDNTWTLNRSAGFSGNNILTGLNISSNTCDAFTLAMTISSFNFTNYGGSSPLFGFRVKDVNGNNMAFLRFRAQADGGTNDTMQVDGFQFDGTANGQFIGGGAALAGLSGTSPITVGLTMNYVANTYTFWIGNPATDDGLAWYNRSTNYTGSLNDGFLTNAVDNLSWAWANVDGLTHFVELDQIRITTFKASPIASYPTNLSYQVSSGTMTLSWPSTHLGWYAQSNSVSLTSGTDWHDVPGSETGTNVVVNVDPAQPKVFYRLSNTSQP